MAQQAVSIVIHALLTDERLGLDSPSPDGGDVDLSSAVVDLSGPK